MTSSKPLIVGVGNPDRGDDGVGPAVIARLRRRASGGFDLKSHSGEVAGLIALMEGADALWLVDAASSGGEPGTIRCFNAQDGPLPQSLFALSTHGFGIAEAIELARAMGALPKCCVVYAVEGACFATGQPLSPPVAAAVHEVADRLVTEIGENKTEAGGYA